MIHTTSEEPAASIELMNREITITDVMQQGEFQFFKIHSNGIAFSEECPEDHWIEVTKQALNGLEQSGITHCRMMAKVADCINFGEAKFGDRHSQALDATRGYLKYNEKTVANACWVFSKIEESRRRVDTLSLSHHEAVAKLPPEEQNEFLEKAEAEALSVSALKDEIKEKHPGKKKTVTSKKGNKSASDKAPTEKEALDGAESVLLYFEDAEMPEKMGKLATWKKADLTRWNKQLHPLEMLAKRIRNAAKKSKA